MAIDISLTDFVDFAMKSGTPKVTKIAQVKERPDYHPAFDFYKRLREAIVSAHRDGGGIATITSAVNEQCDEKKIDNYPAIAKAYKSWWGRKNLVWFTPPASRARIQSVEIRVNPELGLEIDGEPHVVKLYFKDDKLTKSRSDMIAYLMSLELRHSAPEGALFSVLDIRRKNLMTPTSESKKLSALLLGEIAALEAMWASV